MGNDISKTLQKRSLRISANAILLSLYIMLVWTAFLYLNITTDHKIVFVLMVFIFFVTGTICGYLLPILERVAIRNVGSNYDRKKGLKYFLISSGLTFVFMMPWFIAYSPGGYTPDSVWQYSQALGDMPYNDWHPVLHTLIFYKIPLAITGKISSIVFFQIIWFALSIGYLCKTLYKYAGIKAMILCLSFILLDPYSSLVVMNMTKDVGFALACLISTALAFETAMTKGEWLDSWWKYAILGFLIVCTILFRHNGILYSVPLIIYIIINVDKNRRRKAIALIAACIALFILIKGPIFSVLKVEQPERRVVETSGFPLTVIGNVAKETPEKMDEELASFVHSIAPQEMWESNYVCGSFNSIKWKGANLTAIDRYGNLGILRLMIKAVRESPVAALRGAIALTDQVYGIDSGFSYFDVIIHENSVGISYQGNESMKEILDAYTSVVSNTFLRYIWTLGVLILVIVTLLLSKLKWKSVQNWKKILICLPSLMYDFGTMLLLSGKDWRFFYVTYLVIPIIIIGLLINDDYGIIGLLEVRD